MRAKAAATFALLIVSGSVLAQQAAANTHPGLADILNTPEHQWVFNHICVPVRVLGASGYTNNDFVVAYFAVSEMRWNASLEAQRRADQSGSMKAVAPILNSVVDLYWPNRVERDSSGAITRFRDCEELGNLQGMLREEKATDGPMGEVKERVTTYLAQVIRKWKDGRPFEEVAEVLRSGPMNLSNAHAGLAAGR